MFSCMGRAKTKMKLNIPRKNIYNQFCFNHVEHTKQ